MRQQTAFYVMMIVLGLCVLLAADIIADNMPWNDTVSRHIGCQAFLRGQSPYTKDVNVAIARYNIDPTLEQRFSYPAHFCLMTLPLWLLPYEITLRLWIALNLLGFVVLPIVCFRLLEVRLRPWALLGVVVMSLLGFRYSMMTIVLGQYVGLVMVCLWGAVWCLAHHRTGWAAVCLILITFRPEAALMGTALAVLAFPYRPRLLLYYLGGLALLLGLSHLFIGAWELQFVNDMRDYSVYNTNFLWLPLLLSPIGAVMVCGLLLMWLGWGLINVWRATSDQTRFILLGGLVIVLGLVLIPQTNPYTLIYLLPLVYWLMVKFQQQPFLLWGTALFTGGMTWVLFAMGRSAGNLDQLLFPLVLAALTWWAVSYRPDQGAARVDKTWENMTHEAR